VFYDNIAADDGGAVKFNNAAEANLINCTFSNNTAQNRGGCIHGYVSSMTVTNCVIWGNIASNDSQISNVGESELFISYSDLQGGVEAIADSGSLSISEGVGNLDADPIFYISSDGGHRLWPDSPCIDAGDNNSVPADITDMDRDSNLSEPIPFDLDGNNRLMDGDCNSPDIVDMGAHEFAYAYIGDFDSQCDVDFVDFTLLAEVFLSKVGDNGWDPTYNISIPPDNVINMWDIAVLLDHWLTGK